MDIITKAVSPLFHARLREIDRFAQKAEEIQHKQLIALLSTAKDTVIGRQHNFGAITDYNAFCRSVTPTVYEQNHAYMERMLQGEPDVLWPGLVRWFARSSGTTQGRSKFIPVTRDILHNCHYKGGFDSVALYMRNNPSTRFFSKKGLILGGSYAPTALNPRVRCGDLSAVLLQNLNPFVNLVRTPSKRIILMDEWEAKVKAIVDSTYNKDVVSLSGIPSWMLTLLRAVLQKTGRKTIAEVWPNLEVFFHGGVGFEPYRAQYQSLIGSASMRYMETYNASEGFFGLQDETSDPALLLLLDYGIFYEFIPVSDFPESAAAVPLCGVQTGVNYAMVITTCGGLWRYIIGDTVRFTSVKPYKFVITGRTKLYINAFGEELIVDNAERGISKACEATGAAVRAYTAAPQFDASIGKGRHQWLIEFEKAPSSLSLFAEALDDALRSLNSDYDAKRYKDISLMQPQVIPAADGLFNEWLRSHGKLGGQHKIPALQNNRAVIDELLKMHSHAHKP
jgi:hypothetical protein